MLDLRRNAFAAFRDQGFPTLRDEDWRFTRTKPVQERDFATVDAYRPNGLGGKFEELTFADTGCHRVTIVDGHFAADLSRVGDLPEASPQTSPAVHRSPSSHGSVLFVYWQVPATQASSVQVSASSQSASIRQSLHKPSAGSHC